MSTINFAHAKAHLSEVLDRVEKGERIEITRRGKKIAEIVPIKQTVAPLSLQELEDFSHAMPVEAETAGNFVSAMRDQDRY
jgi:prevent-host-death family protein